MDWIEQVKQIEGEPVKTEGYYIVRAILEQTTNDEFIVEDENGEEKLIKGDDGAVVLLEGKTTRVLIWECPDSKADFVEAINKWTWNCAENSDDGDNDPIKYDELDEDYIGEPAGSLFLRDEEGTIYTDFDIDFDVENSEDIAMASYYGPYEIHLFFDKKKVLFELDDNDKWQVKIDSKVIAKNIEVSELKTAIEEILL